MNRLEVLEQTVAYYSEDVNRRCVDSETGSCYYSPKTVGKEDISEGCAVGRLLSKELREDLDENFENLGDGSGVSEIFHKLPIEIKQLSVDFLEKLQRLHDGEDFWCKDGLTEYGEKQVEYIKKQFNL